MGKTIIAEGKTTNEAIEKGLKELNVSKDKVEIKVLENEEKRSFFSILAPRVVKVEITLKEECNKEVKKRKEIVLSNAELVEAEGRLKDFLEEIIKYLPDNVKYNITKNQFGLNVSLESKELGYLIGYRGETLYAFQNILSSIASKGMKNRIRIILDIEGYKEKREKTLQDLAIKIAKTVIRTGKTKKLEPMQAYERKIIHTVLQNNDKVETLSVGEEPNRCIMISLKK